MNDLVAAVPRPLRAILVGGGIAATIDILYACVRSAGHGRSPEWVLQSVASGLLGNSAFESGPGGAVLGLAFHYAILFVAAAVYLLASQRMLALRARPIACGALFVGVPIALSVRWLAGSPREPVGQRVNQIQWPSRSGRHRCP